MSQPRISVYAGSADGNAAPTRVIQGAKTLQARTSHYIAIDPIRDELFVPNPFAQAILAFRGGADGDEAPLRVIQGPKTLLSQPDNVAVDAVHRELFIAQFTTDSIMVYRSDASGDAAPIRVLRGSNTRLDRPIRVEVDPLNNVMAVTTDSAIMVFDRDASGDVPPKWVLSGPQTGLGTRFGTRDVKLYPEGKKIVAGARIRGESRPGQESGETGGRGGWGGGQRFVGVWKYGDTGDTPPWAALNDSPITRMPGSRLALNPDDGELIVGGGGRVHVYHVPEIFDRAD